MSGEWIGIALALAASVALNGSYVLQHAGSRTAADISPRRPVATLASLLRSPLWALGATVGMTGWALHIGALSRAPISLVQAFVAGGLALTVPMAALGLGHRTTRAERGAAAAMVAALALLALGLQAGRHPAVPAARLAAYLLVLAAAAGALAATAAGARRAPALGLAGGILYGAADLALKAATSVFHAHGLGEALLSPWPATGLVLTVGAFFAFQRGLQTGRPVTVIALMTAGTNVTAIGGGFAVFGDPLGRTPAIAALHLLAFVIVGVAAWWLAPSQSVVAAPGEVALTAAASH